MTAAATPSPIDLALWQTITSITSAAVDASALCTLKGLDVPAPIAHLADAAAWRDWLVRHAGDLTGVGWEPTATVSTQQEAAVDRRTLLHLGALALAAPPRLLADLPDADAITLARRVTGQLAARRGHGPVTGLGDLLRRHAWDLGQAARAAAAAARRRGLMAAQAEALTVLCLHEYWDLGRHGTAGQALLRAHRLAELAGDPDILALVWCRRAHERVYAGRPDESLIDARAALASLRRKAHPGLVAQLELHRAEAAALTGAEAEAEAAIEAAHLLSVQLAAHPPLPSRLALPDAARVASYQGVVLLRLGRTARAVEALEKALALTSVPGDAVVRRADLATAYLGAGEVDAATIAARQALELACQLGSRRPVERVAALAPRLERSGHKGAVELAKDLRAVA